MSKDHSRGLAAHLQCDSRARCVVVFVPQTGRLLWSHEFSWPSSFLFRLRFGWQMRKSCLNCADRKRSKPSSCGEAQGSTGGDDDAMEGGIGIPVASEGDS